VLLLLLLHGADDDDDDDDDEIVAGLLARNILCVFTTRKFNYFSCRSEKLFRNVDFTCCVNLAAFFFTPNISAFSVLNVSKNTNLFQSQRY
jgi:hypothetical protein